jgi:hypothetical protein
MNPPLVGRGGAVVLHHWQEDKVTATTNRIIYFVRQKSHSNLWSSNSRVALAFVDQSGSVFVVLQKSPGHCRPTL